MNTSEFLTKVDLLSNQPDYSPSEILGMADDEMITIIAPSIVKKNRNYWMKHIDLTLEAGEQELRLPRDLIANSITDVLFERGDDWFSMDAIPLAELDQIDGIINPQFYATVRNSIRFHRPFGAPQTFRVWFEAKPLKLTEYNDTKLITAITEPDPATLIVTHAPTRLSVAVAGVTFAVQSDEETHPVVVEGLTIDSHDNVLGQYTLTGQSKADFIASRAAVGDHIGVQGFSTFIQTPDNFTNVLMQLTCASICENMGDFSVADRHRSRALTLLEKISDTGARVRRDLNLIDNLWF